MAPTDVSRRLDRALDLAVQHCRRAQRQGCWTTDPDPRITETALACFALSRLPDPESARAVSRARRWLRGATPQRHHPAAEAIESIMRSVALAEHGDVHLCGSVFDDEILAGRATMLHVVAEQTGRVVRAPVSLRQLTTTVVRRCTERKKTKPWTELELLACHALLQHRAGDSAAARRAVRTVVARQDSDGSWYGNPVTTALAFLALDTVSPGGSRWAAARSHLLTTQREDGTWRFCTSDVWDSTLTLRAFRGLPVFDAHCLPTAREFLIAAQNDDGGWPFRRGVESDNDTTAAGLLALYDGLLPPDRTERAMLYLSEQQTDGGLWRTWQAACDPPAEDVVAHVISALGGRTPRIRLGPARRWLAERWQRTGRWSASWHRGQPYATAEVGQALGGHPVLPLAVRALGATQNDDGGWPPEPGEDSLPSSTGLALSALRLVKDRPDDRWRRGLEYLLQSQGPDGTWPGRAEMYGPRPLLSHFQTHTQAFTVMGLRAARTLPEASSRPE